MTTTPVNNTLSIASELDGYPLNPDTPDDIPVSTQKPLELTDVFAVSPNQMNKQIDRGQAPSGIERVDTGKVPNEQTHVHVKGGALKIDGTWKHQPTSSLTRKQEAWLQQHGWPLPSD
jgi:hypothetical protein